MSLKTEIEKQVRRRQRGLKIRKDEQFWRGLSLVQIISNQDRTIKYRDVATGRTRMLSFNEFTSQALLRVPNVQAYVGSLLDQAWAVVGNKALPVTMRIKTAKRYARSTSDQEIRSQILNWVLALEAGRAPRK